MSGAVKNAEFARGSRQEARSAAGATGMAKRLRHRWGEPSRPDNYKTERVCQRPGCGIIKVSHHEGNEHWTDFWRHPRGEDGQSPDREGKDHGPPDRIATDRTPPCEGSP